MKWLVRDMAVAHLDTFNCVTFTDRLGGVDWRVDLAVSLVDMEISSFILIIKTESIKPFIRVLLTVW